MRRDRHSRHCSQRFALRRRLVRLPQLERLPLLRLPLLALALMIGGAAGRAETTPNTAVDDHRAKVIAQEKPSILSLKDALLHDAAAPVLGDPTADVTIVAFLDYNCPYCRKSNADLEALMADDPKVRVIFKEWPILAKSSVKAAKVAIAAAWQGKYAEVHKALMQMNARPATDADIGKAVVVAGADVTRLNHDLARRDNEIVALLKRNMQEADALHLKGTPVYLIGPFITSSPLELPQFKQIVADARADRDKPAEAAPEPADAKP